MMQAWADYLDELRAKMPVRTAEAAESREQSENIESHCDHVKVRARSASRSLFART